VEFVVLPGWRLEEIAAALPSSGLQFSPQEFLNLAAQPGSFSLSINDGSIQTLEGLIIAGSYTMPRISTANEFIEIMLQISSSEMSDEILAGYANQGLSVYQGLIMASMIEREAVDAAEMPLLASVFHNRILAGMRFESDPTVQYALEYNEQQATWWTNPLSWTDLEVDSPYNTYRYEGFPPGPICASSIEAILAAAYPAQTPYYYFRARCDDSGLHQFAESYEEHVGNACP
jgi:UPF0755 protein